MRAIRLVSVGVFLFVALIATTAFAQQATIVGVITDESPVDKILYCWNLGAPRVEALRARGLDPDDYCEVEFCPPTVRWV